MNFKIVGVVKHISETVQVSEKFKKRDIVITDFSMYPQDISFQLSQDNCTTADRFQKGDEIEVSFNFRGREWTNPQTGEVKYFNTLEAWRIETISIRDRGNHQAEQAPQNQTGQEPQPSPITTSETEEDLPF